MMVRMAERSKAPDLRLGYLPITQWERAFWSPNGGVGSNPTSDITFSWVNAVTLSKILFLFRVFMKLDQKRVALLEFTVKLPLSYDHQLSYVL